MFWKCADQLVNSYYHFINADHFATIRSQKRKKEKKSALSAAEFLYDHQSLAQCLNWRCYIFLNTLVVLLTLMGKKGFKYKSIIHLQYLNHWASDLFLDPLYPSLTSFLSLEDLCHNGSLLTVWVLITKFNSIKQSS